MRVLLDTHVFLWANVEPDRLGSQRALVEDPDVERLVSAVSTWEIAIKVGIGRLTLPDPPLRWIPDRLRALAATPVAIEHLHAIAVAELPLLHRDPFDRLLVAQARVLDVPILTADTEIARYDVETLLIER